MSSIFRLQKDPGFQSMILLKLYIAFIFLNQDSGHCKTNYNNNTENIVSVNAYVAGRHSFAITRLKATNGGMTKDNTFDHRYSFLQYLNVFFYYEVLSSLQLPF